MSSTSDHDLAYSIVEQMGLGLEFRNCRCGQLPCARLQPIVDALRQRESEVRAEAWQPIESAPKGREVLMLKSNGKYAIADWGRYCKYNGGNFTHWQPLPDPPTIHRDSKAQEGESHVS